MSRRCPTALGAGAIFLIAAAVRAQPGQTSRPLDVPAGTGYTRFTDHFRSPDWQTAWAVVRDVRETAWAGSPAVEFDAAADAALLETPPMDLSDDGAARLSYGLHPHLPASGAVFLIEYRSRRGSWEILRRVQADAAPAAEGAASAAIVLPIDAYHPRTALRFRPDPASAALGWVLTHARVMSLPGRTAVTVRSVPAGPVEVLARVDLRGDPAHATTPVSFAARAFRTLRLLASADAEGWVFSHWTVNGQVREERERLLTAPITEPTEAVAHYWPGGLYHEVGLLWVDSEPWLMVPISVEAVPGAPRFDLDPSTQYAGLAGETVRIEAPLRSGEYVFLRWVVDGAPRPAGRSSAQIVLDEQTEAVARYGLLGDLNADGVLDKWDVDALILALSDERAYEREHPGDERVLRGDVNRDGLLDELDIEPFIERLLEH